MLHNIYREKAVNCVLKRRLTAVGPFSRNKSHINICLNLQFSDYFYLCSLSLHGKVRSNLLKKHQIIISPVSDEKQL